MCPNRPETGPGRTRRTALNVGHRSLWTVDAMFEQLAATAVAPDSYEAAARPGGPRLEGHPTQAGVR